MRKLSVFNCVTTDGYFTDKINDMSCSHESDPEFNSFTEEKAESGGELIFGRVKTRSFKNGNVLLSYERA